MQRTRGRDRRGRISLLGAIAGSVPWLVAACTVVGPDFAPPPLQVNSAWLEERSPSVSSGPAEYRAWWTAFNDPVLDQLIDLAYRQNLDVRTAGLRVLEARASLGIAVGEFFPQTQRGIGALTYNRVSERDGRTPPGPSSSFEFWRNELGVQLAWELDFWGRFRRGIEAADAAFLGSVAAYDNALVALTSDVAATYVAIRTVEQRRQIAYENAKLQREALELARLRFEGGTTSERDVAQALTVLGATEAQIPFFEDTLQQAKNALNLLLGAPPGTVDFLLARGRGIPKAPPQVAVGIPAELLRRRPDIRQAELAAAQQSALIGVAKADLYPAFSLVGNFGYIASDWQQYDLTDIFLAKSRTFVVGPTFRWDILNYGRITNAVRVQDARLQERLVAYQNTVLRAQKEVEDALSAFVQNQIRVEKLRASAAAARRSQDLAFIQYREGITDFTTVLTAEQNLLAQEDALVAALGDGPLAIVRLYRALGGGWDYPARREFVPVETREVMAERTNWGTLLTPVNLLEPAAPPLPSAEDVDGRVRLPEW